MITYVQDIDELWVTTGDVKDKNKIKVGDITYYWKRNSNNNHWDWEDCFNKNKTDKDDILESLKLFMYQKSKCYYQFPIKYIKSYLNKEEQDNNKYLLKPIYHF